MLRILVIDDWPDTADSYADVLRMEGYDVRVAYSGDAALREAACFHPQVVFLDLALPHLDGYEVARRLRQLEPPPTTIICISGYDAPEYRERAREAGCANYLVKPVDVKDILRLLHPLAG